MAKQAEGLVSEPTPSMADEHRPQAYCDRQGPGYDNDVPAKSWLRSDGEKKPGFDHTGKATRSKV
jgi:hypothetical protein